MNACPDRTSGQAFIIHHCLKVSLPDFFRKGLYAWSAARPRPLPWKGERDPYKVWLSEVILQQTRAEQGRPYYERFVAQYPRIEDLAGASEDEVFKMWEGLGYYSRCRNLIHTARHVADRFGGVFPSAFEDIRALKGVGDYTAAAIASLAFDLPHAVLDGNVYRILARFGGVEQPTDTPAAKRHFAEMAQSLLDRAAPAAYNQAIMDFGATCCLPQKPLCGQCPLSTRCIAFRDGKVTELPVKTAKTPKKERFFLYFVLNDRKSVFLQKRTGKDIWQDLWQFALVELEKKTWQETDINDARALLFQHFLPQALYEKTQVTRLSVPYRQVLTHQIIAALFCEVHLPDDVDTEDIAFRDFDVFPREAVRDSAAFPRILDRYWGDRFL
jgi:A/G-specific adenine glycosylase